MKYTIARASSIDELVKTVGYYLADDWSLQGGVCYADGLYLQSLVMINND